MISPTCRSLVVSASREGSGLADRLVSHNFSGEVWDSVDLSGFNGFVPVISTLGESIEVHFPNGSLRCALVEEGESIVDVMDYLNGLLKDGRRRDVKRWLYSKTLPYWDSRVGEREARPNPYPYDSRPDAARGAVSGLAVSEGRRRF